MSGMSDLPGVNLIFHSIRPHGGMDRHALDLISGFSRRGIALRVVASKVEWRAPENVEFVVIKDRTPFHRFNNDRFERLACDHIRPGWPVIAISRVTGTPVDMSIAGGTHLAHLVAMGRRTGGLHNRRVIAHERALHGHARIIVAHSRRVRDEIARDHGIDPARIRVVYPPIDTAFFNTRFRKDRQALRRALGVRDDHFLLFFPSQNHERKGLDLILEALDRPEAAGLPFALAVAGRKSPPKHPKTLYLGQRDDMPALYAAADAAILASRYEPFGLVGPESVACGTPVLLSEGIGATEVLAEPGCFVFPRRADALAELLVRVHEKFRAGEWRLENPADCIRYPFAFDDYLDRLIGLLTGVNDDSGASGKN